MPKRSGNGKVREPSLLSVLRSIQQEFREVYQSADRRFSALEAVAHRADDHELRLRRLEEKLNQ